MRWSKLVGNSGVYACVGANTAPGLKLNVGVWDNLKVSPEKKIQSPRDRSFVGVSKELHLRVWVRVLKRLLVLGAPRSEFERLLLVCCFNYGLCSP